MAHKETIHVDADPKQWVRNLAASYRERPFAVVRELIQNAVDAITQAASSGWGVEVALLGKATALGAGQFHFVVRDAGAGMSYDDFCDNLPILGVSPKRHGGFIGQFGVGFFSTHSIAEDVTIISRKDNEIVAYRYDPGQIEFHLLEEQAKLSLLANDFENHPHPLRKRPTGTSVYVRIHSSMLARCDNWMTASSLARDLRRDCVILPTDLFVADYSQDPRRAEKVLDFRNRDIRDESLTISPAPWEAQGAKRTESAKSLLRIACPYTEEANLPREFHTFHKEAGRAGAAVDGFLYLMPQVNRGNIELCLKRMWVETARDLTPPCLVPLGGYVNATPTDPRELASSDPSFAIDVSPDRAHVIRDDHFRKMRQIVEQEGLNFYVELGNSLMAELSQLAQSNRDSSVLLAEADKLLSRNALHSILSEQREIFEPLLRDLADTLQQIFGKRDCPQEVQNAVLSFVQQFDRDAQPAQVSSILDQCRRSADAQAYKEDQSTGREPRRWTLQSTKRYFETVGRFLPVTAYFRVRTPNGGFRVIKLSPPIGAIRLLDPASTGGLTILAKGRPSEFFAKNLDVSSVISPEPRIDSWVDMLVLALVSHLSGDEFPLKFVNVTKELFTKAQLHDEWEPLIQLFTSMVIAKHPDHADAQTIEVDAAGFNPTPEVPLLVRKSEKGTSLVINTFNATNQSLQLVLARARKFNDNEFVAIVANICHELYHYAQPAELEGSGEDRHYVDTRNVVFKELLSMLQRYMEMKYSR